MVPLVWRKSAGLVNHRSLVKFFVLTYAVMWTFFITVAAAAIPARPPLGAALLLLGTFAPSLVALWLTARAEGGAGVRALLGRIFQWRVPGGTDTFGLSTSLVAWLTVTLLWLCAAYFLARMPRWDPEANARVAGF